MNKYTLLAVGIILVASFFLIFANEEETIESSDRIGIVSNVSQSEKGFTFTMETENDSFRCFYYEKPEETAYSFKGSFSSDGSMFFISEMKKL